MITTKKIILVLFLFNGISFFKSNEVNNDCIYYCEVSENTELYYGASDESRKIKILTKGEFFFITGIVRDFIKTDVGFIHSSKLKYYQDCSNKDKFIIYNNVLKNSKSLENLKKVQLNIDLMSKTIKNN